MKAWPRACTLVYSLSSLLPAEHPRLNPALPHSSHSLGMLRRGCLQSWRGLAASILTCACFLFYRKKCVLAVGPRFIPAHPFFFFLPKEPSLELPTVFRRKPSNNALDLGVWPDRRHGLPISENHSAESLAHGVGVFIFFYPNM